MENTKTREQSVDTDPMYDNREVVTDAGGGNGAGADR